MASRFPTPATVLAAVFVAVLTAALAAVCTAVLVLALLPAPASAAANDQTGDTTGSEASADGGSGQPADPSSTDEPSTDEPSNDAAGDQPAADGQPAVEQPQEQPADQRQPADSAQAEPQPTADQSTDQQPDQPPSDGDEAGDGADPLANEAEGGEAPAGEVEVPSDAGYDQEEFQPAEVLWSSVAAAETKLNDLTAARIESVSEARALRLRVKELSDTEGSLAEESRQALADLVATTDRMRARSVAGFQYHSSGSRTGAGPLTGDHGALVERQRRARLVGIGLRVDEQGIEALSDLRASLDRNTLEVLERTQAIELALAEVVEQASRLALEREQAQIEYEAFSAGSEIFVDGVVFPIAGEYGTLIDSYGFPRMPGTDDEHWHEGIDIFADRGTPLVATERGVIARIGVGRLGGLKFWLVGESGSEWYYAHLDAFAPGLAEGLVVEAGQLVGYVGNTGNAVGTPPHLHMELHPGGTRPVNPYPLLNVVSQRDRAHVAAGGKPVVADDPSIADPQAERPESEPDPVESPAPPDPVETPEPAKDPEPSPTPESEPSPEPAEIDPSDLAAAEPDPAAATAEPPTDDPNPDPNPDPNGDEADQAPVDP